MNKIILDILRKPEDTHACKSEEEFQDLQYKSFDCLVAAYFWLRRRSPAHYAAAMENSITKAYHHFSLAAADGNADAQFNLAMFFFKGSLECYQLIPDFNTAVNYLKFAADQKAFFQFKDQVGMNIGVAKAENALGNLVRKRRVPGDDHVAYNWYRKSAEHGSTGGQNNLALCLMTGTGCSADVRSARSWFHVAAQQGCSIAKYNLARMMIDGLGGPKDNYSAISLLESAGDQGLQRARFWYCKLIHDENFIIST